MIRRPSFFSIFAKSPFKRLEKHMSIVHQCVSLLPDFYDCCQAEEWQKAESIAKEITQLEGSADKLKRKLQLRLHGDLFLPVPRSDILALLFVQDNIANKAEDIKGLMLGRKMLFPKEVSEKVRVLLVHGVMTCSRAKEVCSELTDLFEAGFEGVVLKLLQEAVEGLDALEREADNIQAEIRDIVFGIEKEHNPLDVYFWYQYIHEISTLIDWTKRVGSQLLILSSR